MSRPKKDGLSYFPLDTGFFEDKRIRRLASRFGADGPLFYIYILCKAYDNGYCIATDDDFAEDAALDLHCSEEKIELMLHYLLDKSLLDSTLFSTVKVLSSHGIQTQYQAIKKALKRDIEVDGDSWILNESETEGFIKVRQNENKSEKNPDKSGINCDKSGINPLKERESKVKGKVKDLCPNFPDGKSDSPPDEDVDGRPNTKHLFEQDSKPYKLAAYLARRITERLPGKKPFTENCLQSWALDFDRLNRIDRHRWQDIAAVLDFSQSDSFWRTNILSAGKFRKQYDRLWLQMKEEEDRDGRKNER